MLQDRPSAGIPWERERESDQGTLSVVILRLTSERPATHGPEQRSGGLFFMAYAPVGAISLDRKIEVQLRLFEYC